MLEHITLSSGDEALLLNGQLVLAADSQAGDALTPLDDAGLRLSTILNLPPVRDHHMNVPPGEAWNWTEVAAIRAQSLSVEITKARQEIEATGITINRSDVGGWYLDVKNVRDLFPDWNIPEIPLGATLTHHEHENAELAVIAAFEYLKGLELLNALPSDTPDSPSQHYSESVAAVSGSIQTKGSKSFEIANVESSDKINSCMIDEINANGEVIASHQYDRIFELMDEQNGFATAREAALSAECDQLRAQVEQLTGQIGAQRFDANPVEPIGLPEDVPKQTQKYYSTLLEEFTAVGYSFSIDSNLYKVCKDGKQIAQSPPPANTRLALESNIACAIADARQHMEEQARQSQQDSPEPDIEDEDSEGMKP